VCAFFRLSAAFRRRASFSFRFELHGALEQRRLKLCDGGADFGSLGFAIRVGFVSKRIVVAKGNLFVRLRGAGLVARQGRIGVF